MRIGIVGHEQAKFSPVTEGHARALIRELLKPEDTVISGGCHLGGVDIFAEEEARKIGIPEERIIVHKPKLLQWAPNGFMARNLAIARDADVVYSLVVKELPPEYRGRRFTCCYHCGTPPGHHVKSGGCWTVKQARRLNKAGHVIVI